MTTSSKRDNEYWLERHRRDGHDDLLSLLETNEISMYQANLKAGYRSKQPRSPAGKVSYHWKRAAHDERKLFVMHHLLEVNRVMTEVRDDLAAEKAKKSSQ
ncbi:MAG: hypothetical protein ABJK59_13590 [Erythrobacter sp.]|uniref:hypothetical protein n=1 Tax=Erythrobacter sp. TaxID=1042 RepID=UPI0032985660